MKVIYHNRLDAALEADAGQLRDKTTLSLRPLIT
jgi:hypothetical protein